MKKVLLSSVITIALLLTPFIRVSDAKAASLVEYALLSTLIGQMFNATSAGSTFDLSKVQYCTTANNTCTSAENDLNTAKLNSQIFQAAGVKCYYDFYLKNKRYPNSTEVIQNCGTEVALYNTSAALIASANTTRIKACELKALACKDFSAILNPIEQQFQEIAQQL